MDAATISLLGIHVSKQVSLFTQLGNDRLSDKRRFIGNCSRSCGVVTL